MPLSFLLPGTLHRVSDGAAASPLQFWDQCANTRNVIRAITHKRFHIYDLIRSQAHLALDCNSVVLDIPKRLLRAGINTCTLSSTNCNRSLSPVKTIVSGASSDFLVELGRKRADQVICLQTRMSKLGNLSAATTDLMISICGFKSSGISGRLAL